ncbi:hypothetical protein ACN4EG_26075 [Alkalinema pantanalense CENA528]
MMYQNDIRNLVIAAHIDVREMIIPELFFAQNNHDPLVSPRSQGNFGTAE